MRRMLSRTARVGIKTVSAAVDSFYPSQSGIAILIYHRVGHGAGGQMDITTEMFRRQMDHLATHHRVLSLQDAVEELRSGDPVEPAVVVTFDDGTDDWVDNALPILAAHSVPATFYVSTDFVDHGLDFPLGGRPITWDGLRELRDSGWATIGNHTMTHRMLDRLPPDEIEAELDGATARLEDELQSPVEHFCYPRAVPPSEAAADAVERRFTTAVLSGTVANPAGANLHALRRSPVQSSDNFEWFKRKASGGMRCEELLMLRRFRKAR